MLSGNNLLSVLSGSPTMIVLLLCSIIVVTFALERWWYFIRTSHSPKEFRSVMKRYLGRNQIKEFHNYCRSNRGSTPRIMASAIENIQLPREDLEMILDTEMEKEQVDMEKNMVILGTLSNIAPLIGLLGTVIGIIRAFKDIAVTGSGGSSVIAMGVSEALLTTAAGIVVAVIATVFFNIFTRKIRVRNVEAEDARNYLWKYLGQASTE